MQKLKIHQRIISESSPSYIIAEIGINHQGKLDLAKQLVDAAVEAKADCAKFQKRTLKRVYRKAVLDNLESEEQGSQYVLKSIIRSELNDDDLQELSDYCQQKGIHFMCTPWDEESLSLLVNMGVSAYKVGSPDMTNLPLLRQIAMLRKPLLISTGMSFVSEIEQVVRYLNDLNAQFVLLHCNSTYPAPYHDINLNFLHRLRELGHGLVGYSGHDSGISVSIAAVALGAKVVEKHITLDRTMEGPDHRASLEPDEFKELVAQIRITEQSMGEPLRYMSRGEYLNRQILSKSLVAARNLKKGHVLHYSDITVKGPGKGTSPLKLHHFIGKKLRQRDVKKDEDLLESDVLIRLKGFDQNKIDNIKHHWGVVARMSDIDQLLGCDSDFIEIHLTDSDVIRPAPTKRKFNRDLVIHGPEYNQELLLDLSSLDERIRLASVTFFNDSFAHARKLKKMFKNKNEDVKFVIHPGGYFMYKPPLDKIKQLNHQLAKSLSELETEGFEPLLENMPSCPWFFGGQWYSTNIMEANDIVQFSKRHKVGITFDTAHAALYCNYYKQDFLKFVRTILPVVRYVHISDASGVNGEGLQIGDGTIDFKVLLKLLVPSDLWFLPEVWQGHKFSGEGFLKAVSALKNFNPDF